MGISAFEMEVQRATATFLRTIESCCRVGFDYDRARADDYTSGFPVFGLADETYYKSKYQEGYLEWMVRDQLVNELLNYLFLSHGYDIRWRLGNSRLTTGGFRNQENESIFPIEFFIVEDGTNTAFRYTEFTADYSISLNLPRNLFLSYQGTGVKKIDKWVAIDWSGRTHSESVKSKSTLTKSDGYQTVFSVDELFSRYFSGEERCVFVNGIRDAVAKANELLGFHTIPKLVSSNLSIFKDNIVRMLLNTAFDTLIYCPVSDKGDIATECSNGIVEHKDYDIMNENFFGNSRYLSLTGTNKFARCFVTAEYMYSIFKPGTSFDYTSVVCGYIKSIEQLCETLIYDVIVPMYNDNLYIETRILQKNEKQFLEAQGVIKWINKHPYICMDRKYSEYFNNKLTMNQMFFFFDVNKAHLCSIEQANSEPKLFDCMLNYCTFDRNGFFHKHNIDDYRVVERIRNNSLLVLYWLLGATVLTGDASKDLDLLGVIDDAFDRIYRKIAYRRCFRYYIKLADGSEHKAIRLVPETSSQDYDENGNIINATLEFVAVQQYPKDYIAYREYVSNLPQDQNVIIIDRYTIPEELYYESSTGEMVQIDF